MTQSLPDIWRATIGATLDHRHFRQQGCQRADSGGLGGAFFAPYQNAANFGVNGIEQEGALHSLLPDYGGKREPGFCLLLYYQVWLVIAP